MDLTSSIGAIAAGGGILAAAFERFRTSRANARAAVAQEAAAEAKQEQAVKDQIINGKEELRKMAQEAGDAWKARYDESVSEFARHRSTAHERANEAQALLLRYTAEIAELRSKTDISPILEHQRAQAEINGKVIQALDQILLHFARDRQKTNPRGKTAVKPKKP